MSAAADLREVQLERRQWLELLLGELDGHIELRAFPKDGGGPKVRTGNDVDESLECISALADDHNVYAGMARRRHARESTGELENSYRYCWCF